MGMPTTAKGKDMSQHLCSRVVSVGAGIFASLMLVGCDGGDSLPAHVEQRVREAPPDIQEPAETDPVARRGTTAVPIANRLALQMAMARNSDDVDLVETVERALGRIGPRAVPAILPLLNDPNPQTRIAAAKVIGRIGPPAADAVPALTQLLEDEDEDVQRAAAFALGEIGPAAESAVPALLEMLQSAQQDSDI